MGYPSPEGSVAWKRDDWLAPLRFERRPYLYSLPVPPELANFSNNPLGSTAHVNTRSNSEWALFGIKQRTAENSLRGKNDM